MNGPNSPATKQETAEEKLYPKEKALIDLVAAERLEGRRVLVYVTHTGTRDCTGSLRPSARSGDSLGRDSRGNAAREPSRKGATMPDETGMETTRSDAPSADDSLFGNAADDTEAAVAEEQDAYTGTLVWGTTAKDGAPPVRVEDAHPAIVSKRDFRRATKLLGSRAPKKVHPRRSASPYLLSGLLRCETYGKAMTAAEAKSGKYTYYVCHSLLKRGSGTCKTPSNPSEDYWSRLAGQPDLAGESHPGAGWVCEC